MQTLNPKTNIETYLGSFKGQNLIDLMRRFRDSSVGRGLQILLAAFSGFGPLVVTGQAQELANYTAIIQSGNIADIETMLQSITLSNGYDELQVEFGVQEMEDGRYKTTFQVEEGIDIVEAAIQKYFPIYNEGLKTLSNDAVSKIQSLIWRGESYPNDLVETAHGFKITSNDGNLVVADLWTRLNTGDYDRFEIESRSNVEGVLYTVAANQEDGNWLGGTKPATLEGAIESTLTPSTTQLPFNAFHVQDDDKDELNIDETVFSIEPDANNQSMLLWADNAPDGTWLEVYSIKMVKEYETSDQDFDGSTAVVWTDTFPEGGLQFTVNGYKSELLDVVREVIVGETSDSTEVVGAGNDVVDEPVEVINPEYSFNVLNPLNGVSVGQIYYQVLNGDQVIEDGSGNGFFSIDQTVLEQADIIKIFDESQGEIGSFHNLNLSTLGLEQINDVFLIPNISITDSVLRNRYSTFREMLARNTGNEALRSDTDIFGNTDTEHHGWGDQINVYLPNESNGTDDQIKSFLDDLNRKLDTNLFRYVSNQDQADWVFDFSNVILTLDRDLETTVVTNSGGNPSKATFKVSGRFLFDQDIESRLTYAVAQTLLMNGSFDERLVWNGSRDSNNFQRTAFTNDFVNLVEVLRNLDEGRDYARDENEINTSPVANPGPNIETRTRRSVSLNAFRSIDVDGEIVSYEWEQQFPTKTGTEYITNNVATLINSNSSTVTFTPEFPGNYRFLLRVTDDQGRVNEEMIDVGVYAISGTVPEVGVNYFSYYNPSIIRQLANEKAEECADKGITWAEFAPLGWLSSGTASRVEILDSNFNPGEPGYTQSDSDLEASILANTSRGNKVLLRPTLEVYRWSMYRGSIQPSNIDAFFESYKSFIVHYAKMAQRTGVEVLAIGNELKSVAGYTSKWNHPENGIIAAVRAVAPDVKLTYSDAELCINPDLSTVEFWKDLDYIGVDVYIPITGQGNYWNTPFSATNDPTFSQFETSISRSIEEFIGDVSREHDMEVLITESGIGNEDGANKFPAGYSYSSGGVDNNEQTQYLEVLHQVAARSGFVTVIFNFSHDLKDDYNFQLSDVPFHHNPKDKPAEDLLEFWGEHK